MREVVLETRVIPIWHLIILAILFFYVAIGIFSFTRGIASLPIIFIFLVFFGSLFLFFLSSVLFGKLKVFRDGIMFRMYYLSFDEMGGIKLRLGGRLMTYGRKLDLGYVLLRPREFVEAVKAVKPEVLVERGKPVWRWKPFMYSMIPLASLTALWMVRYALIFMGIAINPFVFAVVCGVIATVQ